MPHPKTCSYCGSQNHWSSEGVVSVSLCGTKQFTDSPQGPWFCSHCCLCMAKFEMGDREVMDINLFDKLKKQLYPNVIFRS